MLQALAAFIKANPTICTLAALVGVGTFASAVKKRVAPSSKLYHALDLVSSLCNDLIDAWNAVRNLLGKPALAQGPVDSSKLPTPPDRPKVVPAVLLAIAVAALLLPRAARAEVDYAVGPTVPLVLVDLKSGATAQVLSGAGAQLSVTSTAFEREFLGRAWDLLDVVLMGFGTRVQPAGGDAFGQFSAAAGACTMSSLLCAVFGKHLVDTSGGVEGNTGWFLGLNLSVNFALAPVQPQPSDSTTNSVAGLPRGNTLYWGHI